MIGRSLVSLCVLFLVGRASFPCAAAAPAAKPNVLVILADDKYGLVVPDVRCPRQNARFQGESDVLRITVNCGEFRPIQEN